MDNLRSLDSQHIQDHWWDQKFHFIVLTINICVKLKIAFLVYVVNIETHHIKLNFLKFVKDPKALNFFFFFAAILNWVILIPSYTHTVFQA